MDDDIICLSPDNEASCSSQSSQRNPFIRGSQRRSPSSLDIGGSTLKSDNFQSPSKGHANSSTAAKPEKESEDHDIVTLNSDDDSDFEIEYSSQGGGQNSNGDNDDDDDVQVLEEKINVNCQHTPKNSNSGSSSSGDKSDGVDYKAKSQKALKRFINEFCTRQKDANECLAEVREKLMDAYDKTVNLNMTVHRRLHERIEQDTEIIRGSAEKKQGEWATLNMLLAYMEPENLTMEESEDREAQKMEVRGKFERKLARIGQKIRELEEAEVDLDAEDDYNSNYLLLQKFKEKFVQAYNKLCDLSDCSHFTGRPTQTKITLKKYNASSEYPAIDAEVEKVVNKVGFLQNEPFYEDILETVLNVNGSKSLGLSEENVVETSKKLYDSVMKIIKKRRGKDFKISMLTNLMPTPTPQTAEDSSTPGCSSGNNYNSSLDDDVDDVDPEELEKQCNDPADSDPVLLAKLEENVKLRKSVSDAVDKIGRMVEEIGDSNLDDEDDASDEDEDEKVDRERAAKRMRTDEN